MGKVSASLLGVCHVPEVVAIAETLKTKTFFKINCVVAHNNSGGVMSIMYPTCM